MYVHRLRRNYTGYVTGDANETATILPNAELAIQSRGDVIIPALRLALAKRRARKARKTLH